jgi:hypothetical protein
MESHKLVFFQFFKNYFCCFVGLETFIGFATKIDQTNEIDKTPGY